LLIDRPAAVAPASALEHAGGVRNDKPASQCGDVARVDSPAPLPGAAEAEEAERHPAVKGTVCERVPDRLGARAGEDLGGLMLSWDGVERRVGVRAKSAVERASLDRPDRNAGDRHRIAESTTVARGEAERDVGPVDDIKAARAHRRTYFDSEAALMRRVLAKVNGRRWSENQVRGFRRRS
jgi:hypothetical protein